jgi:hypothetical protein
MKNFSAEFDISALSADQQEWVFQRAANHHFDTVMLDKINQEGAWLTVLYDDGISIHFFVAPGGEASFLGTS